MISEAGIASLGCLGDRPIWFRLSLFTPTVMAGTTLAVAALLAVCAVVILRDALDRRHGAAPVPANALAALWLVALFLVVFSSKLLLMRQTPVTTPFWDQWDAEAASLLVPASECRLTWASMLGLHNEHRVFFTRLLALALVAINGQWDPRLEQVVNAAMHALSAVLLATILWLASGRRRLDVIVVACALTFALPAAWENVLLGFQSAFYFLLLFSLLALWFTARYPVASIPWVLGWVCAICALFTAASGVVVPLAIGVVALLTLIGDRPGSRDAKINIALAVLVVGAGAAIASPPIPAHAALKAATAADFIRAAGKNLAWPWIHHPGWSIAMWLPLAALLVTAAVRRTSMTTLERLLAGLAAWVVANAVVMAYGRGAGGVSPAMRYMDLVSLGFVVNGMAFVAARERLGSVMARHVALGLMTAWFLVGTVGMKRLVDESLATLASWRPLFAAHESTVRRFVSSGDPADLLTKQPLSEVPYPDPRKLATVLQHQYIRRILPADIRSRVPLRPRVLTNNAFVSGGTDAAVRPDPLARSWGSFSGEGNASTGRFESEPVPFCVGDRLKFEVSGYLGGERQYLAIRDVRTGHETPVQPRQPAKERWVEAFAPCPRAPYTVVASDDTPASWFAFREPVEMARASIVAGALITHSESLLYISLALGVLAARWT